MSFFKILRLFAFYVIIRMTNKLEIAEFLVSGPGTTLKRCALKNGGWNKACHPWKRFLKHSYVTLKGRLNLNLWFYIKHEVSSYNVG